MSHDVAWCRMAHRGRSKQIRANESLQMERNTGNGWKWPWIWLYFKPTFKRVDSHIFISWIFCSSIPSFLARLQLQPAVEALATVLPGRSPTPVQRFIMIYLYHNHNAVYYRDPAVSALLQHLNPRHAFIIIHQINGRAASDESFWRISSNCFSLAKLSIDSTWYAAYALIRRSLSCKVVYRFWAARLTSGNNTRCPAESVLSRVWVASGVGLLDPGNVKFTRAGPDAFARQKCEVTQKWRCKPTRLEKWLHCKKMWQEKHVRWANMKQS